VREVRVTFTVKDNEDAGGEVDNGALVAIWQEFLDQNLGSDYDMEELKVESAEELSRELVASEEDEEG
jgi:hypothetical protein